MHEREGTDDPDDAGIEARVLAAVEATGQPFEVIEIDPALADTADFCAHYGHPLEIAANCLVVASRSEPRVLAACVVLATTRLDVNRTVRKRLGVRRCSLAPAELTLELTGMQLGGVTPFGLPEVTPAIDEAGRPRPPQPGELPLWIDAAVAGPDRVIVGGGSRRLKLLVAPAALPAIGGELIEQLARPVPTED